MASCANPGCDQPVPTNAVVAKPLLTVVLFVRQPIGLSSDLSFIGRMDKANEGHNWPSLLRREKSATGCKRQSSSDQGLSVCSSVCQSLYLQAGLILFLRRSGSKNNFKH